MADPAQESLRPRAVFLVLVVFALGLVAGAAIWFLAGRVIAHRAWRGHGGPGGPPLEHLSRELKLDSEQRRKVEAIFERHRARFREILDDAHREIREILRPDQRERFDSLLPQHPGPWDEGGPPGPPEGPGPPHLPHAP